MTLATTKRINTFLHTVNVLFSVQQLFYIFVISLFNVCLLWLQVVVAEVTRPSLGVGYELGRAVAMNKKILCLFRSIPGQRSSKWIEYVCLPCIVLRVHVCRINNIAFDFSNTTCYIERHHNIGIKYDSRYFAIQLTICCTCNWFVMCCFFKPYLQC